MLLHAGLPPEISKLFVNLLTKLLWTESLYSYFLVKQIEEERNEVIWPRLVCELQGPKLDLTSITNSI